VPWRPVLLSLLAVLIAASPAAAASKPRFAKSVLLNPVSGAVLVKEPGKKKRRITKATLAKVGSKVDTSNGKVKLTSVLPGGKRQSARFNGAPFLVRQPRSGNGMTDLKLTADLECGSGSAKAARRSRLFGKGKGRFRTRGRNSSATVRGTTWVTQDDCSGTQITSVEGEVQTDANGVDLSRILKPGQSVSYYCDFRNQDEPGPYCLLVLSAPADGLVGMGIVGIFDESTYGLCLTYPSGTLDCGELPLTDPPNPQNGTRQSAVVCFVPEAGSYEVTWGIGGQVLFPTLTTPPITPYQPGTAYCEQQTEPEAQRAPARPAGVGGPPAHGLISAVR